MINSREFSFIQSLFSKEETKSLFSKIKEHYQNDVTEFFENLILYVFTYSETIEFTIDEYTFNASVELLENNKDKFLELLHYNHELKIHSEILNHILKHDYASNLEILSVEDIKQALKEIERKKFKETFKELDKEEFLTDKDILAGLRELRRSEFKLRFKELDNDFNKTTPILKINFTSISKYAAIVILILTVGYFMKNTKFNSEQPITANKSKNQKTSDNQITPYIPINTEIASSFSSSQKVIRIPLFGSENSNSTLTNSDKQIEEKEIELSISHFDNRKASRLLKQLNVQLNKFPDHKNEIQTKIQSLKLQISTHKNTYVFQNQKCSLYLNEDFGYISLKDLSIVCLSNGFVEHFYLKRENKFFELRESNNQTLLIETKDDNILRNLISIK